MARGDGSPSTQNLHAMPTPRALWRRAIALALLGRAQAAGSALRPRFDYEREHWPGVPRFVSDNGAGDEFFVAFAPAGVLIKGFDHESPMSPYALSDDGSKVWPGMYAAVPPALVPFARAPVGHAGRVDHVTFCLAYAYERPGWACGVKRFAAGVGDGSRIWLSFLTHSPADYHAWALDYYDRSLPLDLVASLFEHRPFTAADLAAADVALGGDELVRLAASWGYGGPGPAARAGAAPGARRVRHATFGDGHVLREFDGKVEVEFAAGARVLDRRFVTFVDEGEAR